MGLRLRGQPTQGSLCNALLPWHKWGTRPAPPGDRQHNCINTRCHTLILAHIQTDKEQKHFTLSAVDICEHPFTKNWFSLVAKCALAGTNIVT